MIKAEIVADSRNPYGVRLTSFLLTYPRMIHAEIMTHRVFSRNAASSRAIPVERIIKMIEDNPAIPEWWGAAQKGMQAHGEVEDTEGAEAEWLKGRDLAVKTAKELLVKGLHKQIANRVMEPWSHISVLCTTTEWDNFFSLRAHPDAQPEFQVLAYRMLAAYLDNNPKELAWTDWHLPFGEQMPEDLCEKDRLKVAVARGARLSYVTLDTGDLNIPADILLHDRLSGSGHWSPFEHPAQADENVTRSGNFGEGWRQYRKDFKNENRQHINLYEVMQTKPDWITV